MRLGSHLSVAKGFGQAVEMARGIGANTFQFFTRNPRGGAARMIAEKEVEEWQKLREKHDIFPAVGHLPYTVNMAAPAEKAYNFAGMIVAEELKRMDAAGVEFLVVHPGSHAGSGRDRGMARITGCLEENFLSFKGNTVFLLETMAGQGSEMGSLTELQEIMASLGRPQGLGVCLDSCHLTGAGYDFLRREEVERLVWDLEVTVSLGSVQAVHLNDSKFPPGTHKDRHERIGRGYLGREGILNLVMHPAFAALPLILETPVDNYLEYGEEIALIKSWLAQEQL